MNNKKLSLALIAGVGLMLAGCGNNTKTASESSSSSSSVAKSTSYPTSSEYFDPESVTGGYVRNDGAITVAYASHELGGKWKSLYKAGLKNGLQFNTSIEYKPGSDGKDSTTITTVNVAEKGKSSNLYFRENNNDEGTIDIIQKNGSNEKKIDSIDSDKATKLIKKVTGKSDDVVSTIATNSKAVLTNKSVFGNDGPVDYPTELQGSWYREKEDGTDGRVTSFKIKGNKIYFGSKTGYNALYKPHQYENADLSDTSQSSPIPKDLNNFTGSWFSGISRKSDDGHEWFLTQPWASEDYDKGNYFTVFTAKVHGKNITVLCAVGEDFGGKYFFKSKADAKLAFAAHIKEPERPSTSSEKDYQDEQQQAQQDKQKDSDDSDLDTDF
ncbi:MAG: hypothetical protein Q3959_00520 [Limosilactobacillus sp.]|uniref:hypothetical protein n=1 Tax=Limosilactobacillus sp. TaxID=2773925 RepID=UPI0027034ABB|nr:hypothetical protein [Limosilactobacillus sp.]